MKNKFSMAMSLAMIVAMLVTSFALADDVSNNLDTSVDAVAEVMPLTVGGADGTTSLYVIPLNGDGKNGCNLTGSKILTVSITSSNPSAATVTPASITFTSCGDTPLVTVHPVASGSANITFAQTANTTEGSFNLAPATFIANVSAPPPPTNTAPSVVVAGVTGGASYSKGSVPAATCEVTDAEDGNSSFPATLSAITGPYASDGIGEQTASCSYTDGGGLTASASEIYGIVDPSAPDISYVLNPASPDGSNGWYVSDVTLTWTVSEPESPNSLQVTGCDNQNITADQAATTYSCSAKSAGGSAGPVEVTIKRDATAPTASASASPDANTNGWNNSNVTVSFSGNDGSGSGIDSCSAPVLLSTEGAGQSASGSCMDKAGNVSALATASGINIDKTAPSISASRTPAANANGWNNTDVTANYSASDALSGLISSATDSFVFNTEGAGQFHTFTVTDLAGNSASATVSNVNIDKTKPALNISGASSGSSSVCSSLPTRPAFAPSDALSGLDGTQGDSWVTPSTPSGAGTYTYTAHATDLAGNSISETRTYTVSYSGAFSGYLQPINSDGSSRFKLGSTIPVKFQLMCNGAPISNAVAKLYVVKGDNMPDPGVDEAISTSAATTGNLFRYDSTAQQYIFNLSTKLGYTNPGGATVSFSTGSWTLKILLDDGNWYSVNIQLPK